MTTTTTATIYERTNMYGETVYTFDPGSDGCNDVAGTIDLSTNCEVYRTEIGETVCVQHGDEGDWQVVPVRTGDGWDLAPIC